MKSSWTLGRPKLKHWVFSLQEKQAESCNTAAHLERHDHVKLLFEIHTVNRIDYLCLSWLWSTLLLHLRDLTLTAPVALSLNHARFSFLNLLKHTLIHTPVWRETPALYHHLVLHQGSTILQCNRHARTVLSCIYYSFANAEDAVKSNAERWWYIWLLHTLCNLLNAHTPTHWRTHLFPSPFPLMNRHVFTKNVKSWQHACRCT